MNAGLLQLMQQGGMQQDPRMFQSQGLAQLQQQGMPQAPMPPQGAPQQPAPIIRQPGQLPVVKTEEEFNALPVGTRFIDGRDGQQKFKTQDNQVAPVQPEGQSGQ